MATPLDFMERVVPWPGPTGPGWVNLHWNFLGPDTKPRWRGQPYKTADALISRAQRLTMDRTKAEDIYFCLSVQAQSDTITLKDGRQIPVALRHAENATLVKAIWLDVDVKDPPKGYASLKEALDAVLKFCQDANLPGPSALVASGGGLHVYWFSDRPLLVAEWRPFAEGLKAEAQRLGLRCDYGVTSDIARILRVPGTFNRKLPNNPRPVKVLALGVDYVFDTALANLKIVGEPLVTATVTKAAKQAPFDLSAFVGGMHPLLAAKLQSELESGLGGFTGIDRWSDLPLLVDNVIRECPHFQDAAVNRGVGHGQGLWMLTVLASTWFEDGQKWAKRFSDKYPSFDQAELDAMWDRKMEDRSKGIGWPSCKAFENEGCKLCKTCKWHNDPNVGSPLKLANRAKPPEPEPAAVVVNPQTQAVLTSEDLRLPNGYSLVAGRVCFDAQDPEDPKAPPRKVHIFEGEIISQPKVVNGNPPKFYFKYKEGDNFMEVSIPFTAMKADQTLLEALLEAGVHVNPDADKVVRRFMRSFTGKIDAAVRRLNSSPLGWVYDNGIRIGFAFGGVLYRTDGSEEESGHADNSVTKYSGVCGNIDPVLKAHALLAEQNNPSLEVLALQSWASPLLELSGLSSTAVVWGYSLSGAHKSSALKTGAAVWYAPVKLRERDGATANGLENKMDMLRSLPCILDEMTNYSIIDKIEPIFNRIGEGGDGSRSTRSGKNREKKFWSLILACGSNKSLYEYFDYKKVDTDARAVRVFEIVVEKKEGGHHTRTEVDDLIGSLEHNYGHLGAAYSKYLAVNFDALKTEYAALAKEVELEIAPPGADRVLDRERFWLASIVLTLLANRVANRIMNKDYYNYEANKAYLYSMLRRNRDWIERYVKTAGSTIHTGEAWATLLREWINNQIVTDTMHTGSGRPKPVNILTQPPLDRGYPILMHWLQHPPMLRVSQTAMIETLNKLDGLGVGAYDKFQKEYGGTVSRKVFLAGIPVKETKTKQQVWEIPITQGHPLYDEWLGKFPADPADPVSAAATAQDAMAAGVQQAAADMEKVKSST